MISAIFLLYCSALQISLARIQGLLLIVITHNSPALKENGVTEDILLIYNSHQEAHVYKKNRNNFLGIPKNIHCPAFIVG